MAAENPQPWTSNRKMPYCFEEVTKEVTMRWEGIWQPDTFINFYCKIGKRDVTLMPHFYSKNDTSTGCEGCPLHLPNSQKEAFG